jgi:hypothetical protein
VNIGCAKKNFRGNLEFNINSRKLDFKYFKGILYFKTLVGIWLTKEDVVKRASTYKYFGTFNENIIARAISRRCLFFYLATL